MDKLSIKGARFLAHIGESAQERSAKQEILVDVDMFLDTRQAATSEELADTVDYANVHKDIQNIIEGKAYKLLETLAQDLAKIILQTVRVQTTTVRIKKPQALADRNVQYTAIEITRQND